MNTNNKITFYELNTSQPIDVDNVVREFNEKSLELRRLINENQLAVETFRTNFMRGADLCNKCAQKIQELKNTPKTTEIVNQENTLMQEAKQIWNDINQQSGAILVSIRMAINLLNDLKCILINKRLAKWKCDQILAGYGDENTKNASNLHEKHPELQNELDEIQIQFEALFEWILTICKLLDVIRHCYNQACYVDNLGTEASSDISKIQHELILSCIVINEQPTQVIKKDTRFDASVRLLLPNYITVTENCKPEVTVSILSESQSRLQQLNCLDKDNVSGEIIMDKCYFETSPWHNQRLLCNLRTMQLKKIHRAKDKKTHESVMDEKFSLIFQTSLRINNTPENLCAMSLPVTVAVHGTQEAEGWATITWDNSFFEIDRILFTVRSEVPWSHMKWALKVRFYYQTGCHLSEDHLQYLYEKIFGSSATQDRTISWSQFCKTALAGRNFPFFTWFYEATKLTRVHLSKQWKNGLIEGFISKDQARNKLLECSPGTFLLRFSDSELGGISVAWVQRKADGSLEVENMQPFTHNDFENPKRSYGDQQFLSIGDLIKGLGECTQLYPGIPKELAFGEYYTQVKNPTNGYVPKQRSFVTPFDKSATWSISSPNSYFLNSPQNWQSPASYPAPSPPSVSNPDDVIADIVEYLKEPMDDYDDDSLMNQFLKFNNRTDSNLY